MEHTCPTSRPSAAGGSTAPTPLAAASSPPALDDDRTASLVNPLTGDAAPLPCAVARGPAWSRGVFCSNGAVLCDTTVGRLVAAVLQPGKADWEEIHVASPVGLGLRDVPRLDEHDRRAAALCSSTVASCCASTSWT